jgi:hypothetical protein
MITSLINPSGEVSIQDSLWHIASSNNSGQTDFKFVFDVFVNGVQLVRTKIFPEPTNGKGYFDASQVVRNSIQYDWFTPTNASTPYIVLNQPSVSGQIAQTYNIRVGEDYSGLTTLNLASGNITAYNWTPPVFKRRKQTTSVFAGNWITNRGNTIRLNLGDKLMLPFKCKSSGTHVIRIRRYNASNTLIGSNEAELTIGNYVQFDLGQTAINQLFSNSINSNVKYYDVRIQNPDTSFSDVITFQHVCDNRYTPIALHFMNQYGMFESAIFNKSSRLSMDVERKAYNKRNYVFGASSVDYYNTKNVYYESAINYGSKVDHAYKLTMDFPTDEEWIWLSELITTPQVYMELDGNFYPISINANNYEYNKNQNVGLKPFELNININQQRNGFRR